LGVGKPETPYRGEISSGKGARFVRDGEDWSDVRADLLKRHMKRRSEGVREGRRCWKKEVGNELHRDRAERAGLSRAKSG